MEQTQIQTLGDPNLFDFLVNAPKQFRDSERIKKFQLRNGDYIHCVLWNYHFYITGTDIVKILIWRFQNAGRQIGAIKKFEEGIFSDLRNLKPGVDATLENPRSDFLEFLYKNGCIRTQKKQKVFFWYSVPHDALFFDAMERNLRRDSNLYAQGSYCSIQREAIHGIGGVTRAACARQKSSFIHNSRPGRHMNEFDRQLIEPIEVERDPYGIRGSLFGHEIPQISPMTTPKRREGYENGPEPIKKPREDVGWIFQEKGGKQQASQEKKEHRSGVVNDFDDFDFGQFEFLKERYKEHFGEEKESCRQKLFEGDPAENKRSGRDTFGEVHFIENKGHRPVE